MYLSGYDYPVNVNDEILLEFSLIKNMVEDINEIGKITAPFKAVKLQAAIDLYIDGKISVEYAKIYDFLGVCVTGKTDITSWKKLVKNPKLVLRYYNMTDKLMHTTTFCHYVCYMLLNSKYIDVDQDALLYPRLIFQIMTNSRDDKFSTIYNKIKKSQNYSNCCFLRHPDTIAYKKYKELYPDGNISSSGPVTNYVDYVVDYVIYNHYKNSSP